MTETLFAQMYPPYDVEYECKLALFNAKPKLEKKYTQSEIVLNFLGRNPSKWFYVWELMGEKPRGWVSHKVDCTLSTLHRDGKIDIRYIGKYAVYSIKNSQ